MSIHDGLGPYAAGVHYIKLPPFRHFSKWVALRHGTRAILGSSDRKSVAAQVHVPAHSLNTSSSLWRLRHVHSRRVKDRAL
ncbi:MAG: hypothetical protein QF408_14590, partial [Pirellulales bacterium]|nr:hypothetical protein [Pirellulales bacterium]